jgi:DNA repair protein RadA/Sms
MAKVRSLFRCNECGGSSPKWVGRCPTCGEWNTLAEEVDAPDLSPARLAGVGATPNDTPIPIAEVDTSTSAAAATGIDEVDRVLSGGLVPGSVTLVGGEPGIGKSTLLLQDVDALASRGARALYVSAEESKQQVRLRADRLGTLRPHLYLAAENAVPHIVTHLDTVKPDVVVIDSIQTVHDPQLPSAAGSVTQVRECASRLVHEAKSRGVAVILVGHVTKDGNLAGPRVLEHIVDTVLSFEGDRHHGLRLLRAVKHRFGSTDELGLFEMTEAGLKPIPDASALFLADRRLGVAGSAVVPVIEGHRPLLVELQALVNPTSIPTPRRSAQGVDNGRLSLLAAVLERRADLSLSTSDIYALAVGGVRIAEPAADLALCLAIASSFTDASVPPRMVACGEVGLGGEIRQVAQLERRLNEAARLGFTDALVPLIAPEPPPGIRAIRVGSVADAIGHLEGI